MQSRCILTRRLSAWLKTFRHVFHLGISFKPREISSGLAYECFGVFFLSEINPEFVVFPEFTRARMVGSG